MGIISILFWVAIFSGSLLILLLLFSIWGGFDMEFDVDPTPSVDVDGDMGGLGMLKGALTFISVGTWVARIFLSAHKAPALAIAFGIIIGVIALLLLNYLLKLLLRNEENVNWSMQDALFQNGKVYLRIPKDGEGIVQVDIKGAFRELKAKSRDNKEIPTGSSVLVVEVINNYVIVENKD